jgi:2-oxoisovalerate dehydrogenase E1 component
MVSSVVPALGTPTTVAPRLSKITGLNRDELIAAYRLMVLSRAIDDREIQLRNQSHTCFQISGAGHEAILTAASMAFRPGYDWFFPYYRDRALCLGLGMTPYEMFLAAVGAQADGMSAGRQMPSHWSSRRLHIPTQSSVVASQCLHAVGCAEATVLYRTLGVGPADGSVVRGDEVTYVSVGDGGTSEGEFWEALNSACTLRLPLVVLVEDNGYAISTPVATQTPGGDIGRIAEAFPYLTVLRSDGTDFADSLQTMRHAVTVARSGNGPVLVHARCTRPYSHSHSDDETLYKPLAEREDEARRDPVPRMALQLLEDRLADDDLLSKISGSLGSGPDCFQA